MKNTLSLHRYVEGSSLFSRCNNVLHLVRALAPLDYRNVVAGAVARPLHHHGGSLPAQALALAHAEARLVRRLHRLPGTKSPHHLHSHPRLINSFLQHTGFHVLTPSHVSSLSIHLIPPSIRITNPEGAWMLSCIQTIMC